MYLEIKPTTTLTELRRNSTSAADSFPGWPNGVAKPSRVSNVPLHMPQQKLAHIVPWWGTPSHPNIGYNSADSLYIARLVADLKRRGIDGATWLWNGVGGHEDLACLAMKAAFEAAGLKFAIMPSSKIPAIEAATDVAGRTKALNGVLDYLKLAFFTSPAYLRVPSGRPELFFFGFSNNDFDWTAVRSHMHAMGTNEAWCVFRMEIDYGAHLCADGYFGWLDNSDAWVAFAKKFGKPLVIGINGGFNNTFRGGTVVNCTWGVPHVIDQKGGLTLLSSIAQASKYPEIWQAQLATWNDYQEDTAIEPGIATGLTLLSDIYGSNLNWTPLTAAFDHAMVYISPNGEDLMPLVGPIRGDIKGIDLAPLEIPLGKWSFVVEGVGINSVQNVLSNLVTHTLGWD